MFRTSHGREDRYEASENRYLTQKRNGKLLNNRRERTPTLEFANSPTEHGNRAGNTTREIAAAGEHAHLLHLSRHEEVQRSRDTNSFFLLDETGFPALAVAVAERPLLARRRWCAVGHHLKHNGFWSPGQYKPVYYEYNVEAKICGN